MAGSLRQLIPDDHVLVRVDAVLDLSWLRGEIADLYCPDNGRPGIDPEVAVRLMLAGFLLGIVHDRRVMREAAVNIAIRWFVGYGVHEALPDHSSLTRIRQRWSAQRFRQIFERTVQACIAAKIATGKVVHIDASLIRAHVSWEALAVRHIEAVAEADEELRDGRQGGTLKKVCVTDPDATMATNGRNRRLEPAYKQHTAVDDVAGVIVDVEVATGQENEGMAVASRLDAIVATTGKSIAIATMDAGYAYAKVFRALEDRKIKGIVPPRRNRRQARSSRRGGSSLTLTTTSYHRTLSKRENTAPEGQAPARRLPAFSGQCQRLWPLSAATPMRQRFAPFPRGRPQSQPCFAAQGAAQATPLEQA